VKFTALRTGWKIWFCYSGLYKSNDD